MGMMTNEGDDQMKRTTEHIEENIKPRKSRKQNRLELTRSRR